MKTKDSILKEINENPGISLTELSKNIMSKKSNVSFHIKNLEKDNLIVRYLVEENNKKIRLHPTRKGKEVYLKIKLNSILKKSIKATQIG